MTDSRGPRRAAAPVAAAQASDGFRGAGLMGLVGQVLDMNGIAACEIDSADRIVGWNESYLQHFPEHLGKLHVGWPYADNLRQFFLANAEGVSAEDREERIRMAIERHRTMREPNIFQKADGRWMRAHIHRRPDGSCIKMWADVSERFAGDRGMAGLFDTLGAVDVAVLQYAADLRFRFANRKAGELLPRLEPLFREEAHYNEHLATIAREELHASETTRFLSLTERQDPFEQVVRIAMILQRRDGGWLRFQERVGQDRSLNAIFTDITELKQMEDANDILAHQARALGELSQQLGAARDAAVQERERAEDASRAKSRFLATMTHELRTPLNAILGFSEIMRDQRFGPIGTPRYGDYAGMIHDAGRHLLSLINDILDLSKIEAGRRELHQADVDVRWLADDSLLLVHERLSVREIAADVVVPAGCERVWADERAAKQILVNLLANAAKFTPPHGRIMVGAAPDADGGVWLYVVDNGLGMTDSQVQRALQPFGQAEDPLVRQQEGTGLGLPIVKALAEAHGGCLVLQSKPAEGTRASVYFPARPA